MYFMVNQTNESSNMAKKGGKPMKVQNNTDTPKSNVDLLNVFLVAFHVLVVVFSLIAHPIIEPSAAEALP